MAAGPHTFTIQATNEFDMVEQPAVEYEWTITDAQEPTTSIELGPPATTSSTTATFSFSSNETDASFECALDTPAGQEPSWNVCAEPPENTADLTDLALGQHNLLVRAIDPSENFDSTPESYSWTVVPPGPPNTPAGTNVTATHQGGGTTVTATFGSVTAAGYTFVESLSGAAGLPLGYLPNGAKFYDVSTTAGWIGDLTVCLTYDPNTLVDPVRLLHFDGSVWVDVTTSDNRDTGVVCGEPGSLSAFAIASATSALVPDTSVLLGPDPETTDLNATFAFESDVAGVVYECALDTPAGEQPEFGSCEATHTFEGLLPGPHELLVRAKDDRPLGLGLYDASPARYEWTIVSLETVIDEGPAEATEETTASFRFSSDYPGATFECMLDEAIDWSPCDAETTYTGLIQEEHELLVRARTPGGAVDQTPAEWSWEIGDVPPQVVFDVTPELRTENRSARFEFSTSETGVTFECALDGAAFQLCSSPKVYNGLILGTHTLQVQVFSPEAIVEQTPATYTWEVVDDTAPTTTIDFGPPAVTGMTDANLSFSSDEQLATFECSLNGVVDPLPCGSPAEYSGLAPGSYTFEVVAIDPSGNRDASPATHSWRVVERPETTIDSGPESDTTSTSAEFTFSSSQPGSTFECSIDAGPFLVCTSPKLYTGILDGDHTLAVRARNADGVEDDTPAEYDWTVDLLPDTSIVDKPAAVTQSTSALFTFGSNEAEVTFECSLDGAAFAECLSPHNVGPLADGEHTLRVRTVDGSSQLDPTPAAHTWRIDTTAPDTAISDQPSSTTQSTSASFSFSAEAGSSFACSLDGAAPSPCSSPKEYTGLSVGDHSVEIQATDAAGNAEQAPARYSWTVEAADTTAPETTLGSGLPAATTTETDASLSFSSEAGATFECSLNDSAWAACDSPKEYTGLTVGPQTFKVRAKDGAGNVDESPAEHSWTVEALPGGGSCESVTLTAEADSWINQLSQNATAGSQTTFRAMSLGTNRNRRGLVRFAIPDLPAGCEVESATLRLFAEASRIGRTMEALRVTSDWAEGSVNWSNRPSTAASGVTARAALGWVEWNVTSAVNEGAERGFMIRDLSENNNAEQVYTSREGSQNKPQLVITLR
jgi:hypothetical protein